MLFSYMAPNAREVFLGGTFNDWNSNTIGMLKGRDGAWTVTLHLTPGRYEYKFFVDGDWKCDEGCDHSYRDHCSCVVNSFGTTNRVIDVV